MPVEPRVPITVHLNPITVSDATRTARRYHLTLEAWLREVIECGLADARHAHRCRFAARSTGEASAG